MKVVTQRTLLRGIHLIFGIPILGYAYSPFEVLPNYAPTVRYVAVPAIVFSGLWMWMTQFRRKRASKELASGDTIIKTEIA